MLTPSALIQFRNARPRWQVDGWKLLENFPRVLHLIGIRNTTTATTRWIAWELSMGSPDVVRVLLSRHRRTRPRSNF